MRAIVVADGDVPSRSALDVAWPGWADGTDLVVAADGGALAAERLGLPVHCVVGDGDSIGEPELVRLAAAGARVILVSAAKDETDTELAIAEAARRGADKITVLGALGGPRLDHELANVGLLALPVLAGRETELLDPRGRVSLLVAPGPGGGPVRRPLPGLQGTLVSLLPFAEGVAGVTTEGFVYPLRDEPLPLGPARGISNVRSSPDAAVTVRSGRLLIVEAPATLRQ